MFIKSNILRSGNAFSTRQGGVSAHEHTASLNLAFGRGDEDSVVLQNLEIFAQRVGFDSHGIVSRPQIHSDKIITVTNELRGQGYYIPDCPEGCDGYVTDKKGIVLGIKTADCVPILFEAEKGGEIIAIGAVHAGWRGTVADIAGKCVERLCSEFGAEEDGIRASIGPCIHSCCYEVGEDVFSAVYDGLGEDLAERFVVPRPDVKTKYTCDLAGINRELIYRRGVPHHNVEIINECTSCNPQKFFSHRYSSGRRGTMLNVIFMK